ncbi:hypothetical protein FIBSPDRAFT_855551, partial [Athelia psychrophila]
TFFETGLGTCGVYNVDTDYIIAVSEAHSYTHYGGVNVQATITDRCAGCAGWGDLDMTPSLFTRFAAESVGHIYSVGWVFV